MTGKELYLKYAKKGIYLTRYLVSKIMAGHTVPRKKLATLTNPNKGAYSLTDGHAAWCASVSKPLIAIDERGKRREFKSLCEASAFVDRPGQYANIRNSLKTGQKAYGYTWVYANANSKKKINKPKK